MKAAQNRINLMSTEIPLKRKLVQVNNKDFFKKNVSVFYQQFYLFFHIIFLL